MTIFSSQHRLNTKGYVLLYKYVPEKFCNRLLAEANSFPSQKWECVFGHGNEMDTKRRTIPAPAALTTELFSIIEEGCKTFFPTSTPQDWSYLKSLKGGDDQSPHRDFSTVPDNEDLYDYSKLPASVIVGLEDGSFLFSYGWNRLVALEIEKEKVFFEKGDLLIFRCDLIHGGGGYTQENIRLHGFLESVNPNRVIRQENAVDLIRVVPRKTTKDDKAEGNCYIYNCRKMFASGPQLREHIRTEHGIKFNNYPETVVQPKKKRKLN